MSPRSGDGYSTSRYKRSGGMFRHEARVTINYEGFNKGLDNARKGYAIMIRELKANPTINFKNGVSNQNFPIAEQWKSQVKWRVNSIGKNASALMKEAMLQKIGGRIETGDMKGSIYGRTEKPDAYTVVSRAGWLDLWYKYFGFQEEGTDTGIKPMRAIQKGTIVGRNYVGKELSKLARELRLGKKGPM